jgi:formylglycine-generating enzyme required for sulfatase activity
MSAALLISPTAKRELRCTAIALLLLLFLGQNAQAGSITFGSSNQFTMEFVTIGNPGNTADTGGSPNPAGSVAYGFQIGKYEVSRDMIVKYNAEYGTANSLEITLQDMTAYGGNGSSKPATGVSWNEAARFVNWLNTSQGYAAAYKFTTSGVNDNISWWTSGEEGYNAANPVRNSEARFVLPVMDEWYKAAYYDPDAVDWFKYPTSGNTAPSQVPDGGGTDANTMVYNSSIGIRTAVVPEDVNLAGGLSPYGVMAMGGNAREWMETTGTSGHSARGGSYANPVTTSSASSPAGNFSAKLQDRYTGFRVADLEYSAPVPEPRSLIVLVSAGLVGVCLRTICRRRRSLQSQVMTTAQSRDLTG